MGIARYHVLISRFSWPHPIWNDKTADQYSSWLSQRLELFEKYTIRSVKNLNKKPDIWMIMLGKHSNNFVDKLKTLLDDAGVNYKLIIFSNISLVNSLKKAFSEFEVPCEIWSTRLDTDDLIACDYFTRVASLDISEEMLTDGCGISFPGGVNYLANSDEFFFTAYPDNPFLTYAEIMSENGVLKTVYFSMHTELLKKARHATYLRSHYPMWASVIHGSNMANNSLVQTCRIHLLEAGELKARFGVHDKLVSDC